MKIFQFLPQMTSNSPAPIWRQVTSGDLRNYFIVIIGPRSSFWYAIWLCLKTFGFDPKCPKYHPIWGQVTSSDLENHFFVITVPRTSFWHVICIGLKMFGFWPQMTPNTPRLGHLALFLRKFQAKTFRMSYPALISVVWVLQNVTFIKKITSQEWYKIRFLGSCG